MLNVGTIAQKYFWIIGSAVALLILFVMRWRKTQSGAERIDRLRLKLPFLGEIWLKYQIAMFSRTLATLLAGGLPLVTCLETAPGSMERRLIANPVSDATFKDPEGHTLSS